MSIEQGQAFFGNCTRKLFVSFLIPKKDTHYAVCVQLRNDRDTNPLDLSQITTLIRKRATGFEVELSQHVDSPYYAIQYTVVDGHTQDSILSNDGMYVNRDQYQIVTDEAPPPFKKECTCEGHTLFHKGCQCGAVSKKKWGLGT